MVFPGGSASASYLNAGTSTVFDQLPTSAVTLVAKVYVTTVAAAGVVGKTADVGYYGMHGVGFWWDVTGALRFTAGRAYTNMLAASRRSARNTRVAERASVRWKCFALES